jgi:hypothetical protein
VKRLLFSLALISLIITPADAIEVRLRDGTVVDAASYRLTGSYLMLTLAGGQQVAYDVADVDVEALKAAEQAAKVPEAAPEEARDSSKMPRSLKFPDEDRSRTGITITDEDVAHVRRDDGDEGELGDEDQEGPPPGFEEGGGVVLGNLRVTGQGEDRWLVEGEVINRSPRPVINVRVQLQTIAGAGETPWSGEVPVTSSLPPDEAAVFSHAFSAAKPADKLQPDVRASVIWMQAEPSGVQAPPASRAGPRAPGPVPTPEV